MGITRDNANQEEGAYIRATEGRSLALGKCDVSDREVPEEGLRHCYDCGKAYCKECADKWSRTIQELGVCLKEEN